MESVRSASVVALPAAFLWLLPRTERCRSYTSWNCLLTLWCLATGTKQLLPFLFCSSVAVNNSFHFAEAVQPGVFAALAAEGKFSRRTFWLGDFTFHVLVSLAHRMITELYRSLIVV